MNASFRDLKRRADTVTPPLFDVADMVERGNARLRRRHAALAAGAATIVVAAIAVGTALTARDQQSIEPIEDPTPTATHTPASTRQLTYTDDYDEDFAPGQAPQWLIRSINYGDQVLRPDLDVMHMDVTDDGVALVTEDGGIHFTDGTSVEKIGELTIDVSWSETGVESATSGSLLAWFTPAEPDSFLVVYDTREREFVARARIPGCLTDVCWLEAVVGDHVYVTDPTRVDSEGPHMALNISDGTAFETDQGALWQDLRAHPRALIKSDSPTEGEVVGVEAYFEPRGSSLRMRWFVDGAGPGDADDIYAYGGFDTTGRRLNLRLPDGYKPAPGYALFQWLDDDRFAVMAGAVHNEFGWSGFPGYGDILVCNIADGRCELAAQGPTDDGFRARSARRRP